MFRVTRNSWNVLIRFYIEFWPKASKYRFAPLGMLKKNGSLVSDIYCPFQPAENAIDARIKSTRIKRF